MCSLFFFFFFYFKLLRSFIIRRKGERKKLLWGCGVCICFRAPDSRYIWEGSVRLVAVFFCLFLLLYTDLLLVHFIIPACCRIFGMSLHVTYSSLFLFLLLSRYQSLLLSMRMLLLFSAFLPQVFFEDHLLLAPIKRREHRTQKCSLPRVCRQFSFFVFCVLLNSWL